MKTENKLAKLVCRIVGHDWDRHCFECLRCNLSIFTPSSMSRIAKAMTSPLRTTLDYKGIGRKLLKTEKLEQGDLPIYDEDIK